MKILLSFLFIIHWSILGVSIINFSGNQLIKDIKNIVYPYYSSGFSQKWRLFAPDPSKYSKKIYYRCISDSSSSDWADIHAEYLENFYKYRVSYHGKLVREYDKYFIIVGNLAISNGLTSVCKTKECMNKKNIFFNRNIVYHALKKRIKNKCDSSGYIYDKFELIFVRKMIRPFDGKVKIKDQILRFPINGLF